MARQELLSMSKPLVLPVCTSCGRAVMPNDQCVKFYCPSCGYVIIWRCESCRDFSRQYKCVGCGFEGP
jgi:Zn-ribbon RNA-binding protein